MVNMEKSDLMFSKNMSREDMHRLKENLGVVRSLDTDLYLGLPMAFRKAQPNEFKALVHGVHTRVQQWSSNFFLVEVRRFLLKPVPKRFQFIQ